jgi:predicted ATP-dependent endonuclease of OLD family
MIKNQTMQPLNVYIKEITLKNIKCFLGDYKISLSYSKGTPCQWTVLLGNNNTGKTTFLRAVSELQAILLDNEKIVRFAEGKKIDTVAFVPQASSWHRNSPITPKQEKGIEREISMKLFECFYNPDKKLQDQLFGIIDNEIWHSKVDIHGKGHITVDENGGFSNFIMYGYGALRRRSNSSSLETPQGRGTDSLFSETVELLNVEDWILRTQLALLNSSNSLQALIENRLKAIRELLISDLFEDITDFRVTTTNELNSYVEFLVNKRWVSLESLGYGYQNSIIWLVDFAKLMFDRYPEMDNPLHGPAIVLVDEIDLHLHPEWQRKIIKYLSDLFPNTQFIVTAHSPLIVQSAENVNLIMLEKDDETGSINVRQQFGSFQGWTVEEILRELMDMGEKTRSDRFLHLLRDFETGLLDENYDKAKVAYDELDKILHPASSQRKLLSIQLSSLIPV